MATVCNSFSQSRGRVSAIGSVSNESDGESRADPEPSSSIAFLSPSSSSRGEGEGEEEKHRTNEPPKTATEPAFGGSANGAANAAETSKATSLFRLVSVSSSSSFSVSFERFSPFRSSPRTKPFAVATSAVSIADEDKDKDEDASSRRVARRSVCAGVAASAGTTTSQILRHRGHLNSKSHSPVEISRPVCLVSGSAASVSAPVVSEPNAFSCVERTYRSRHAACAPWPHVTGRKPTHSSASTESSKHEPSFSFSFSSPFSSPEESEEPFSERVFFFKTPSGSASSSDARERRVFGGVLLARARPALGANALCLRASQHS